MGFATTTTGCPVLASSFLDKNELSISNFLPKHHTFSGALVPFPGAQLDTQALHVKHCL